MSLGIGQVDDVIVNNLLVAPHFSNISLPPTKTAPREGAIAYDETTKLLYYSSQYKWVPISTSGSIPPLPQGLLSQQTSPTGTTINGVTITTTNSGITITNGNGVGGNPTLTFNGVLSFNGRNGVVLPALGDYTASLILATTIGMLIGPTIQSDLNYLGTIFNQNNGFHVFASGSVPPTSNIIVGNWSAPTAYFYSSDPNFDPIGGLYMGDGSKYHISVNLTYSPSGIATTPDRISVLDTTAGLRLDNTQNMVFQTVPPGQSQSMSFSFDAIIPASHTVGVQIVTFANSTITYTDLTWSLRKVI
jgi:hypothetical protein